MSFYVVYVHNLKHFVEDAGYH